MDLLVFIKSLADYTRLRCMLLIQDQGELCVCELMSALQLSQPKISRHLAQLRQNGLLIDRRQGKWVYYQLHPDLPEWASDILATAQQSQQQQLTQDLNTLQRLNSCC